MKKLTVTLVLLIYALTIFAQKLPDNGISSETHRKNIGKTIFSKTEVLFKKENLNTWTNSFNWGDPIYARMYWGEGINNIYKKEAWAKPADTYRYVLRFYANGKYFAKMVFQTEGERTSLPLCLYPASYDTYDWGEMKILENYLNTFKVGKNTIKVEVCAYNRSKNLRSKPISSGTFTLNITKQQMDKARSIKFYGIKTAWSNENAWKEWELSTSWGNCKIKSTWDKLDEWEYSLDNITGKIKTVWSGKYTEWELTGTYGTIKMKQKWSNNWKEWEISDASKTVELKTTWNNSNAWQEWELKSDKGTMKIKVKWSNTKNAWQEWEITDNMRLENTELKLAAVFMVIFHAMPK
jgi:hypothetical protein